MDALEAIMTRRSTRKFRADAVPEEMLKQVIEAGRRAPSGGNNQTTHLIVIEKPEVLAELPGLVEKEFSQMEIQPDTYKSLKNAINAAKKGGYIFHYHAPVLIVVANKIGYGNALADSACVLENMMVAANALDLGTVWINQLHWLTDHALIRAYLGAFGLAEAETITGGLAIGWPDTEDGLPNRAELPRTGNPVTWVK